MLSTSVWNASGCWSRSEKRTRVRARRSPRVAMTVDVHVRDAERRRLLACSRSRHLGRVGSGVHHATAIVAGIVVGQYLGHARPSRGPRSTPRSARSSACRVFQPRRLRLQFLKPRERGVEVCLVEDFAAADQVAFDREEVDHPPLGVEALLRGPMHRLGDDRSEVAQPMHGLDVDADVRREVPRRHGWMRPDHRPRSLRAADGRCSPNPASSREVRAG